MNIAEDVRDAGLREFHFSRRTTFIQAQVKGFSTIDREDVVKEGILIRKLDFGSDTNSDDMG
jgi:hypothetical protein